MGTTNNIGTNNPVDGVRVFDDLNQLAQVVLETLVLIGSEHSGAIGKCTLQDVWQALTAVLAENELGFPTSATVTAALKPNDEHRQVQRFTLRTKSGRGGIIRPKKRLSRRLCGRLKITPIWKYGNCPMP